MPAGQIDHSLKVALGRAFAGNLHDHGGGVVLAKRGFESGEIIERDRVNEVAVELGHPRVPGYGCDVPVVEAVIAGRDHVLATSQRARRSDRAGGRVAAVLGEPHSLRTRNQVDQTFCQLHLRRDASP